MAGRPKDSRDRLPEAPIAECTAALRALPWLHPSLNSSSAVKMAAEDAQAISANSFVLGKHPLTGKRVWVQDENFEHFRALNKLFDVLSRVMREQRPDFEFHQITVNKNLKCKKHRDSHNKGESYIIGFGDYQGGELTVWPEDNSNRGVVHDVRHRLVRFNGRSQYHETAKFVGVGGREPERYTCVFYSAGPNGKWKTRVDATSDRSLPVTAGQQKAIEAPFCRPLAIVAGAGCGKTFTLIKRIQHLVTAGISSSAAASPSTVIVLTFSKKACAELKDRLSGGAALKGVQCLTFHAFALRLHREFGNTGEKQAMCLNDASQQKMIHACLDRWFESKNPESKNKEGADEESDESASSLVQRRVDRSQDKMAKRFKSIISKAKSAGMLSYLPSSEAMASEGDSNQCLRFVFEEYSRALRTGGRVESVQQSMSLNFEDSGDVEMEGEYTNGSNNSHSNLKRARGGDSHDAMPLGKLVLDFDDMVPGAIEIMRRPVALNAARRRYRHCFVDEFQDTSMAQLQLLLLLWGDRSDYNSSDKMQHGSTATDSREGHRSLTVVGDDDQMIYGWRDAMRNAFATFEDTFFGSSSSSLSNGADTSDKRGAQFVKLDTNFRTKSPLLLRAACNVVQQIDQRYRPRRHTLRPFGESGTPQEQTCLSTRSVPHEPLRVVVVPTLMHEADVVVARVIALLCGSSAREMDASTHQQSVPSKWCSDGGGGLEKMRERVRPSEIVILCRNSFGLSLVRKRLAGMGVPNGALDNYTATGKSMVGSSAASAASENGERDNGNGFLAVGLRFLQRRQIADALAFLKLVVDECDNDALLRILRSKAVRGLGKQFEEWLINESKDRGTRLSSSFSSSSLRPTCAVPLPLLGTARQILEEATKAPGCNGTGRAIKGIKRGQLEHLRSLLRFLDDLWALICFSENASSSSSSSAVASCPADLPTAIEAISQRLTLTSYPSEGVEIRPRLSSSTQYESRIKGKGNDTTGACASGRGSRFNGANACTTAAALGSSTSASKPVGFVSAAHLVQSGSALQGAGTLDGSSFLHKHAGNKTNSLRKEDKADAYEASLFLKSLRMLSERFAADNGVVTASSSSGPRELGNASVMAVRCFLDAIEGGDLSLAGTPAIKCMGPSSKSGGATSNPFGGSDGGKVTLGTIHKAKGLEWNHVFVVGCSEGGLPSLRGDDALLEEFDNQGSVQWRTGSGHSSSAAGQRSSASVRSVASLCRDDEERMNEERRLFHVAVTRAKETCTVVCPKEDGFGNSVSYSRFIDDISSKCQQVSLLSDQLVAREFQAAERLLTEATKRASSSCDTKDGGEDLTVPVVIEGSRAAVTANVPPVPHLCRPLCPRHCIAMVLINDGDSTADGVGREVDDDLFVCCPVPACTYKQKLSEWLKTEVKKTAKDIYGNDASYASGARKPCKAQPRTIGSFFATKSQPDKKRQASATAGTAAFVALCPLEGGHAKKLLLPATSSSKSATVTSGIRSPARSPLAVTQTVAPAFEEPASEVVEKTSPMHGAGELATCVHGRGPDCQNCALKQQSIRDSRQQKTARRGGAQNLVPARSLGHDQRGTARSISAAPVRVSRWSRAERQRRAGERIGPFKRHLWNYVEQSIMEKQRSRSPSSRSPTRSAGASLKHKGSNRSLPLLKGQQVLSASSFLAPLRKKARPLTSSTGAAAATADAYADAQIIPECKSAPMSSCHPAEFPSAAERPLPKQHRGRGPSLRLSLPKKRRLSSANADFSWASGDSSVVVTTAAAVVNAPMSTKKGPMCFSGMFSDD